MTLSETLEAMTPEQIMACVDECDGWKIFSPEELIELGLPEDGVHNFVRTYKSDGSAKGSIWNNSGEMVKELTGIYGLEFLIKVARELGVEYDDAMGRGFQARNIQKALREHFDAQVHATS